MLLVAPHEQTCLPLVPATNARNTGACLDVPADTMEGW